MYDVDFRKVRDYCSGNNLRPKEKKTLHKNIIVKNTGTGTYINQTCILKLGGIGISWAELEIINPGDTDCTKGLKIMTWTNTVFSSYDIDGYDTCQHCKGAGVRKHDFRSVEQVKIVKEKVKMNKVVQLMDGSFVNLAHIAHIGPLYLGKVIDPMSNNLSHAINFDITLLPDPKVTVIGFKNKATIKFSPVCHSTIEHFIIMNRDLHQDYIKFINLWKEFVENGTK